MKNYSLLKFAQAEGSLMFNRFKFGFLYGKTPEQMSFCDLAKRLDEFSSTAISRMIPLPDDFFDLFGLARRKRFNEKFDVKLMKRCCSNGFLGQYHICQKQPPDFAELAQRLKQTAKPFDIVYPDFKLIYNDQNKS